MGVISEHRRALWSARLWCHGYFTVWRRSVNTPGLPGQGRLRRTRWKIEAKMRRNGRVSMWLALVSLVLMAGARYASPIFA